MAEDRTCLDCIAQYSHLPVKLCEEHADERRAGETRMTLEEWLNKWGTADDGEPETEWQKGYEAARDMVNIQLKCRAGETRMTLKELAAAAEAAQEKAWEANNAAWAAWQAAQNLADAARALANKAKEKQE